LPTSGFLTALECTKFVFGLGGEGKERKGKSRGGEEEGGDGNERKQKHPSINSCTLRTILLKD